MKARGMACALVIVVAGCGGGEGSIGDAAPADGLASSTDAAEAQWLVDIEQIGDEPLFIDEPTPSGRFLVVKDDERWVFLDTTGARPPRHLESDRAYAHYWIISEDESVVAYLNGENLMVAEVESTGPPRVVAPWWTNGFTGTNGNAFDSWSSFAALSPDGQFLVWAEYQLPPEEPMIWLWWSRTDDPNPQRIGAVHSVGVDVERHGTVAARFVGGELVFADATSDTVMALDLATESLRVLGPGVEWTALDSDTLLVFDRAPEQALYELTLSTSLAASSAVGRRAPVRAGDAPGAARVASTYFLRNSS